MTLECSNQRLVILWVCDPVQRLISSHRFAMQQYPTYQDVVHQALTGSHGAVGQQDDIESVVSTLAQRGGRHLVETHLDRLPHGSMSLSWYLDGDCSVLDDMPNLLVGRREFMDIDFFKLLEQVLNLNVTVKASPQVVAKDAHRTQDTGRTLSAESISHLRGTHVVQADYACLRKLVADCLLEEDYVDEMQSKRLYSY